MKIRQSVTSDLNAIKQLHLDAFSGQAGTSSEESRLVANLAIDLIGASPSVLMSPEYR